MKSITVVTLLTIPVCSTAFHVTTSRRMNVGLATMRQASASPSSSSWELSQTRDPQMLSLPFLENPIHIHPTNPLWAAQQEQQEAQQRQQVVWNELCDAVGVLPAGLVRLQEDSLTGIRGVYMNQDIQANDVVLSIPLKKCLRDDQPPAWMPLTQYTESGHFAPTGWAARLAACFIQEQFALQGKAKSLPLHIKLWLSLLPNADFLRASLPIHWDESLIRSTRCTALEVAVDGAFFARAAAVQELQAALVGHQLDASFQKQLIENALDVVQTRTCRVEVGDGAKPVRLLAPVFDFLNHHDNANAAFSLQGDRLVIRALVDLHKDQEVLIDYGESARPAWKCLTSYGFVPSFPSLDQDLHDEDGVAEVYMNGIRYEVGTLYIPEEMVAAALDSTMVRTQQGSSTTTATLIEGYRPDENVELTPEIAMRLAQRISDFAYQLLVDPPASHHHHYSYGYSIDDEDDDDDEEDDANDESAEHILSAQLAASLRWNQHRILLKCSRGLQEWAAQQQQQSLDNQ